MRYLQHFFRSLFKFIFLKRRLISTLRILAMMIFPILLSLLPLISAESSQLPQLVNADGSLTNQPNSMASNLAQNVHNGFQQAGQSLQAAGQNLADRAQGVYQQGQHYLQQGLNNVKDAAHQFGNTVQQAGSEIAEGPRHFLNGIGQMNNNFQDTVDNAFQGGVDKIKEVQTSLGEKFKPLTDKAMEIFGKPGNEREHWNEVSTIYILTY